MTGLKYGQKITIPKAPVKKGYKFLYWKGSKYYPGDKYTVTTSHKFTALLGSYLVPIGLHELPIGALFTSRFSVKKNS